MGFLEVLSTCRTLLLLRTMRKMFERGEVAVLILIDYPASI